MKVFLKSLLLSFALCVNAFASTTPLIVNITWGFSPSVSAFNYSRHIVEQANHSQQKYLFTLDYKPGAAGSIAARHVINEVHNNRLAILMTSSAYFVRPHLYNNPGYSFDEYDMIAYQTEVPMALVMKKGRKFQDIIKQPTINMSIAGQGSLTHVMAERFKKVYPKQINLVGYNGTREAVKDVIGGDLDLAFDIVGSVMGDDKVEIVGISGSRPVPGLKLLSNFGPQYSDFKTMALGIFLMAPKNLNQATMIEIRQILQQAQKNNQNFKFSVQQDYGAVVEPSNNVYQTRIKEMNRLTSGMAKFD